METKIMEISKSYRKIVGALRSRTSAVFCGAGISFNSGLPVVASLLEYLFSKLQLTSDQIGAVNSSNLPFESIMEMTLMESGIEEIQEIFSGGSPNSNHRFIAKLAKLKYLQVIYTTNFDVLIEKALEEEGLQEDLDFQVYSSEKEFNAISWETDIIKLIKIHGSATKKEEMVITMSLIASDSFSETRRDLLSQIFCAKQCKNVLVLGYSCSDIDLTPLIESFEGERASVFFVEHTSIDGCTQEPITIKKEKNPFQTYNGLRVFIDTDVLVKDIWMSITEDEYINNFIAVSEWQSFIDKWYFNAVQESGMGVKHHISSRILYAIGEFDEAIKHNKEAIAIALKDGNVKAYSSEMGNMGMALDKIRDFEQAQFCLSESISLCKRIGNTQGLMSHLQAYANVLHHLGKDYEAIKSHKEALNYANKTKDDYAISNILGNMSNSYNRLGRFKMALKSLNKALLLSRKIGNKQAESSQLGIISRTYFSMGDHQKAAEYCERGIKIKKSIGDRYGECGMLNNLIGIYQLLNKTDDLSKIADYSLGLAQSLGDKHLEFMIKVNLGRF